LFEEKYFLSRSMGRVIEKVSFNYYSVNKRPKDYDKEIKKKKFFLEL